MARKGEEDENIINGKGGARKLEMQRMETKRGGKERKGKGQGSKGKERKAAYPERASADRCDPGERSAAKGNEIDETRYGRQKGDGAEGVTMIR